MDPHAPHLERFLEAQDRVYAGVLDELAMGQKTSHWMWFIFPQLRELGQSPRARHFGIASATEACSYWQHAVLGPRLKECVNLLLAQRNSDIHDILGTPDDLKFRSSMTLFALTTEDACFGAALDRFFSGKQDASTVRLLKDAS